MSAIARLFGELLARMRGGETAPGVRAAGEASVLFPQCVQLAESGRLDPACDCYRRLLELDPLHGRARNNLGILHQRRGELQAAADCFEQAARVDPRLAEPHVNLGNLDELRGDPDTAAKRYQRALEIDPHYAHAHCSLAQSLLAMGRYREGWEEFEWRWRTGDPRWQRPPFPQPVWDGTQDIAGRRVLLHAEQGFGDAIQFIRYAPQVAARGASVVAACDPALVTLFRTVPGVGTVADPGQPLPDFEYHAALMSLPRACGTTLETIPASVPYFAPDPIAVEAWRARLHAGAGRLKVGLAWAGSPMFVAATMKVCPLQRLAPVLETPGCDFFSLQKGAAAAELREPGPWSGRVTDYTAELHDFGATAALIAALDLVISIDTATAHLAGALGKPVWVLLAAVPDWRWLPRAGPLRWYPTATLFRQHATGDWSGVVDEVERTLRRKAEAEAAS